VRFAFYGRVSTAAFQDRASSRQWQRDSAVDLIGRHGRIVVEFFDVGCSRRLPWPQRPQARLLLEALTDLERGFDAVVVGEVRPRLHRYPSPGAGPAVVYAGPHPNRAHAAWGRLLHRPDDDPTMTPTVRWIFAQRKAGLAVAGIERALSEAGVPCPSKIDADRNRHRSGQTWTAPTVSAILAAALEPDGGVGHLDPPGSPSPGSVRPISWLTCNIWPANTCPRYRTMPGAPHSSCTARTS
jgi:hypothetical protein